MGIVRTDDADARLADPSRPSSLLEAWRRSERHAGLRIDDVAATPGGTADPVARFGTAGLQDLASPLSVHAGLLRGMASPQRGMAAPSLVWVQDAPSRSEFGSVHARGLWGSHGEPAPLVAIRARRAIDALWATEEALHAGLPVVVEIGGCPRALDFTATRRLEMRARSAGVACFLVRTGPGARISQASAARHRWRVTPRSSAADPYDPRAPGTSRWLLELVRARDLPPGAWVVEAAPDESGAPHRLRVVAELAGGGVATRAGAGDRDGTRGTVVPLRPGRAA